jgi:hypothetical protein
MPAYTEYPQENIDKAIALAQRSVEGVDLRSADVLTPEMLLRVSPARFSAGCIAVVSQGSQVCLRVPIFGDLCIPVDLPDGTAAEACVDIRTIWPGIPVGACLTIRVLNNTIFRQCIGL